MLVKFENINLRKVKFNKIYKHVFKEIGKQFPKRVFEQRAYLYFLFTNKNSNKVKSAKRSLLINPTAHFLLNAKVDDSDNPFDEKQNDKAEILVAKDNFY